MHLVLRFTAVGALTAALSVLPAQIPFGQPTGGTGGVEPNLATAGIAYLGNLGFGYEIDGGLGGAFAVLAISTTPVDVPVGSTRVLVSPLASDLLLLNATVLGGAGGVAGAGATSLPLPLPGPVVASIAGFDLFAQAIVLDPAVPGTNLAATQGIEVEVSLPPRIFVGTSVGGSADPTWLVDPSTLSVVQQLTSGTNNVTDAEFTDGGRYVYVGTSLGNQVAVLDADNPAVGYAPFWSTTGVCYGIGFDRRTGILYTASDGATGSRELVAIDAQQGSPGYGAVIGTTTGLGASMQLTLERWQLSPSGKLAAVIDLSLGGISNLYLVDTDPASSGYLTYANIGPIPASAGAFNLALPNNCVITPRDEQVIIVIQQAGATPGEVARFDLRAGAWIDHDPATAVIDNIGPFSAPPAATPSGLTGIDISLDGTTLAIAGISGGVGGLLIDPQDPGIWSYSSYAASSTATNTWACAVSPDGALVAFTDWAGGAGTAGAATLTIVDALTGAVVGTVPLGSAANVYTCRWR